MKKIIALILAVIMMFSMTSVSYATDTTVGTETSATTTIDNYMDYLETKLEGENFFVQLIARLVIIGVMLGFIKIEDFEAWFDNTAPDTDTEVDNDEPTADDNNTNTDWEDGTEVTLHHAQALPYTEGDVTITDVKVTKEHCDVLNEYNKIVTYKYNFEIRGKYSDYKESSYLYLEFVLEKSPYSYGFSTYGERDCFEFADDGTFVFRATKYSEYDSSRFTFTDISSGYDA